MKKVSFRILSSLIHLPLKFMDSKMFHCAGADLLFRGSAGRCSCCCAVRGCWSFFQMLVPPLHWADLTQEDFYRLQTKLWLRIKIFIYWWHTIAKRLLGLRSSCIDFITFAFCLDFDILSHSRYINSTMWALTVHQVRQTHPDVYKKLTILLVIYSTNIQYNNKH